MGQYAIAIVIYLWVAIALSKRLTLRNRLKKRLMVVFWPAVAAAVTVNVIVDYCKRF